MTTDNQSLSTATIEPPAELAKTYGTPAGPQEPPQEAGKGDEAVPSSHPIKRQRGFAKGNDLWRRRESQNVRRSRLEVREAMLSVLTPDKMAKAVRKMLAIISSSDKKAAVAAFKVLTDAAGIRQNDDSSRTQGAQFTFVLPGPGVIPARLEVQNTASGSDKGHYVELGPAVEVLEGPAAAD